MKKVFLVVLLLSAVLGCLSTPCGFAAESDLYPSYLRCEYKVNPLGIDVLVPRLTWEVEVADYTSRGLSQSAYQILVSRSRQQLQNNVGDLWDSGKVKSSQTSNIEYQGKSLGSDMDCFWKVRVWDQDGHESRWSNPARWSMGLLSKSDWSASWIEVPLVGDFDLCKWVWYPDGDAKQKAPVETCFFRKTFSIPAAAEDALLVITGDDTFTAWLDGKEIAKSPRGERSWDQPQIVQGIAVGSGTHTLAVEVKNTEEGPAGLTGKMSIVAGDVQYIHVIDDTWKVSKTSAPDWKSSAFDDSGWKNAKVLSHVGMSDNPWGVPGDEDNLVMSPPPFFVKGVNLTKKVKRAMAYASAQGIFELEINGQKVGDEFFRPGWSDYRFRLYYNTYDVTELLNQGENQLTAMLAPGWYTGYIGWGRKRNHYDGEGKIIVQFNIEYEDGTRETIGTDPSWQILAQSPIRESEFLHGETYDARLEGNAQIYRNAVLAADQENEGVAFDAYPGVNVKAIREIVPQKISEPKPGVFIYDLGQNMVGFVRLSVQGPRGQAVQIRFSEMLNEDGTLYVTNLRSARAVDTYLLKGDGVETWQPRFTFHGFRYVEVTGYPGHPGLDAITGVVLHSDIAEAGSFECSDAMVNQLVHNIDWGMRGNYLELPTDCPQRDERMGWMGDAQVFIRTGTYNKDIASFFTKWMIDVVDSQRQDGSFTDVAPDVAGLGSGTAAWADAGVICPYNVYWVYGDTRILEEHYPAMQKYIEYLKAHSDNLIRPDAGYADWLNLHADTPRDLLGTAYFAYSTRLMVEIANAIDKPDDAKEYQKLYEAIRAAFIKKYLQGNGQLEGNTQTGYVLAMDNGLIPENRMERAAYYLIRDLQVRDYHFSTGFAGLPELFPVLTKLDRLDLAYRLLLNDSFPSWGFEIKNGATTIWERWDGWTPEFGFQDPGMNSFNHYAYGAVGEWIYSVVGGIDTDGPGFKQLTIWPRPGGDFRYAKTKYRSIHGWIGTFWRDSEEEYVLTVNVPANTTATVYVKARNPESVTESGKPVSQQDHVDFVEMKDGFAVYKVASGTYTFESIK